MSGSAPSYNTWFLGPTRVLNPNGISIGSAVFAGHTSVTDRPTHRQTNRPTDYGTRWVTIGRIYARSRLTAMRPNNSRLLLMLLFLLTRKFRFIFWVVYYKGEFLPVRRYASAVLAVVLCTSVRLSQSGIVSKRV